MNKVVCISVPPLYQDNDYVGKLYRGAKRNTTQPFEFEVIRQSKYPGWWAQIELFPPKERIVVFDLDVVITGNIDYLFDYDGPFCAWKDPYADGFNMSVMSIALGFGACERQVFDDHATEIMKDYKFVQQWLWKVGMQSDYWEGVYSYKADIEQEPGPDCRVVCCHGKPKPHELMDIPWVKENWR